MAPDGSRDVFDAIHAALVLLFPVTFWSGLSATSSELLSFGGVTGRCTRSIPVAEWHCAHNESSGCAWPPCAKPPKLVVLVRPFCASAMVTPMPVAKLMPSWQAPQANRLGLLFQLLPCAVCAVDVDEPSWHLVQLRRSWGYSV